MVYAQLYHRSTGTPVQSIPMCGSDGVVMLDGRKSRDHQKIVTQMVIERHLQKDSITGYQIIRAQRFTDEGQKLTGIIHVVDPFPPVKVD